MWRTVDNRLQQVLGLPYLYLTRDFTIHSRCGYLLHKLERIEARGLSVLDVGCGAGIALRHIASRAAPEKVARYVGIDLAAERLKPRYADIRGIEVAFCNVDLDDPWFFGTFDVIWCSEVIEHLMNDLGQVKRLAQALKPEGRLFVTAPSLDFVRHVGKSFPPILQVSATQDGGHVRLGYQAQDLQRLAGAAGLAVAGVDGVTRLTIAQTRRRYTLRGPARMALNLSRSSRLLDDFALAEAFARSPEAFHSIAAELVHAASARLSAMDETTAVGLKAAEALAPAKG